VPLTFAFSPCPNDTFAFHALVHGLVDVPVEIEPVLLDIEELNRRARNATYDLSKVSVGALPAVGAHYDVLRSGAALGYGVGPLVVAREPQPLEDVVRGRVAIPGYDTTAFLLLRLLAPAIAGGQVTEMRFDGILDAVSDGKVDAGLIIHESRFTYAERGLVSVADLGELWEAERSLPVPLATICARRNLDAGLRGALEGAIRASVEYAFARPEASADYVRANAQELSPEVCRSHIELYVNDFTIDLGDEGLAAVEALTASAGIPAR
jgi:1,4-dihydroxy-6-naphthoate synthase